MNMLSWGILVKGRLSVTLDEINLGLLSNQEDHFKMAIGYLLNLFNFLWGKVAASITKY